MGLLEADIQTRFYMKMIYEEKLPWIKLVPIRQNIERLAPSTLFENKVIGDERNENEIFVGFKFK
jgi:hypothetical protein